MAAEAIQQVVAILNAAAGVTVLVGTRITPMVRPQDLTLPAITMQRISMVPSNSLQGNAGLDIARVQVDCWGATYTDARSLATAARAAMDAAASILMDSEQDVQFIEEPPNGIYRIIQEYTVFS
jgi:hypothetical protein